MDHQAHPFSVIVHNEPGVLSRVAGLLSRRGFNIESLTVGETAEPAFSRMTIIVRGGEQDMEQVRKQLGRLVEVVKVTDLFLLPRIEVETALIKVAAKFSQWNRIIDIATRFQATVADTGPKEMVVALVGHGTEVDRLIGELRPFGILELARTGKVSMVRCRKSAEESQKTENNLEPSIRMNLPGDGPSPNDNFKDNGGNQ